MPDPVSKQQIDQGIAGWESLMRVGDDVPSLLTGDSPQRTELVAGLRELADFLETRLDVPVDRYPDDVRVRVFAHGNREQMRAQVEYAARLMGAEIVDETGDGGHYKARREFGQISYEMVGVLARQPEPAFAPGQEVRLNLDARELAAKTRLAQAGYVTACEEDPAGGHDRYTVHFPGRAGDQGGWGPTSLDSASFEPVQLPGGVTVTSMQAAETMLIEQAAQIRIAKIRRKPADGTLQADHGALAEGLARICGLEPSELLEQMQPQVSERLSDELTPKEQRQRSGAQLAASDRPPEVSVQNGAARQDDERPVQAASSPQARGRRR